MCNNIKKYKVYMLENKTNGKKYIGLTMLNLKQRLCRGYRLTTKIGKAIKEYGFKNFNVTILYETYDKIEAEHKEQELIKILNTIKDGYNMCQGGYTNYENLKQDKKVLCVELNCIFESARKAGMALNISEKGISSACRGTLKTSKGYHWKYIKEENI